VRRFTTNNIVGEAHAFANFHVTRTALAGAAQEPITQKFYYALGFISQR
jgi:hypothetical protein